MGFVTVADAASELRCCERKVKLLVRQAHLAQADSDDGVFGVTRGSLDQEVAWRAGAPLRARLERVLAHVLQRIDL